jgi:hypothetical protein
LLVQVEGGADVDDVLSVDEARELEVAVLEVGALEVDEAERVDDVWEAEAERVDDVWEAEAEPEDVGEAEDDLELELEGGVDPPAQTN